MTITDTFLKRTPSKRDIWDLRPLRHLFIVMTRQSVRFEVVGRPTRWFLCYARSHQLFSFTINMRSPILHTIQKVLKLRTLYSFNKSLLRKRIPYLIWTSWSITEIETLILIYWSFSTLLPQLSMKYDGVDRHKILCQKSNDRYQMK